MNKYKIEKKVGQVTLFKRFLFFFWIPVDCRRYVYSQHAVEIAKKWIRQYGKSNF